MRNSAPEEPDLKKDSRMASNVVRNGTTRYKPIGSYKLILMNSDIFSIHCPCRFIKGTIYVIKFHVNLKDLSKSTIVAQSHKPHLGELLIYSRIAAHCDSWKLYYWTKKSASIRTRPLSKRFKRRRVQKEPFKTFKTVFLRFRRSFEVLLNFT